MGGFGMLRPFSPSFVFAQHNQRRLYSMDESR